MALPYITESNLNDFAEVPEFSLDELLAQMRAASARYASGSFSTSEGASIRANAGLEIERLIERIRQDYPTHYEGRR